MDIKKVIYELSNTNLFTYETKDTKLMLIDRLETRDSIIGKVLINLLEQAEKGKFK